MNLTRNLYLLFLCGMCIPAVYAAGNITADETVTADGESGCERNEAERTCRVS